MGFFDDFFQPINEMKQLTNDMKTEVGDIAKEFVQGASDIKSGAESTINDVSTELKTTVKEPEAKPDES